MATMRVTSSQTHPPPPLATCPLTERAGIRPPQPASETSRHLPVCHLATAIISPVLSRSSSPSLLVWTDGTGSWRVRCCGGSFTARAATTTGAPCTGPSRGKSSGHEERSVSSCTINTCGNRKIVTENKVNIFTLILMGSQPPPCSINELIFVCDLTWVVSTNDLVPI